MTFIFVRFCHFFSLHKVHCKCMQTSFCGAVLSHKIMFFNLLRYSKTSIETNIILTFSSLQKIHLEKSNFFFVTRLRRFSRLQENMSLVCGGFNEKKTASSFASISLSRCSRRISLPFFFCALKKKHTIKPHSR